MLTVHQQQAISSYIHFTKAYPQLFSQRVLRRIVSDRSVLERYAEEHGRVLGVVAETPHAYFIVDLVEAHASGGESFRYPYLRLIYRSQLDGAVNTAVLGTIANPELGPVDAVVMIRQERHATGLFHWELPRGFAEVELNGEQNALKELQEETGYCGERAALLGKTYTDTGVMDATVSFYHVPISRKMQAKPEREEAITHVQLFSIEELWQKIRNGEVTDSFTLQALALLNR